MEADVAPLFGGPYWMPITPKGGPFCMPIHTVCAVARRHGLSPQQLFGWRRQARQAAGGIENAAVKFVPAVVEATSPASIAPRRRRKRTHHADPISGLIEVEIADMTVRFGRGADAKAIAAVLRVLKAGT